MPDTARGAGHQHAAARHRPGGPQQPHGRQAGERQGGGHRRRDRVGQRHQRVGGDRDARRPAAIPCVSDDARARQRPRAVSGGLEHRPGDVLPGSPPVAGTLEQEGLAAVDREGLDRDEGLILARDGLRHLRERDPRVSAVAGHKGSDRAYGSSGLVHTGDATQPAALRIDGTLEWYRYLMETNPDPFDVLDVACPTRQVLARIGDKWSMLVICALEPGTRRFSHLRRHIGGMWGIHLTGLECGGGGRGWQALSQVAWRVPGVVSE